MNERLRELAKQAGFASDKLGHLFGSDEIEKFAELIVKECMDALWTEAHFMSDLAVEDYQANCKRIKQHFGVE